ncbi:MAG TPA: hypothetical protein VF521_01830, partial [Pyrinomonadaceae bacterium]
IYRRKFGEHVGVDYERGALTESILKLFGDQGSVEVTDAAHIRLKGLTDPPKAKYDIRLTGQRITYGYYRIDDVAFVVPLDMKKSQDPAPFAWIIERQTAPLAFQHYLEEFQRMFEEALLVYPSE